MGISNENLLLPTVRARRSSGDSAFRLREPLTMVSKGRMEETPKEAGGTHPLYPRGKTGVGSSRRGFDFKGGTQCYEPTSLGWTEDELLDWEDSWEHEWSRDE